MPDSRDRFQTASLIQAIADTRANFARLQRATDRASEAATAAVRETAMPEGYNMFTGPWTITTRSTNYTWSNLTAPLPSANWLPTLAGDPGSVASVLEDPTTWWGSCGMARCSCGGPVRYRDERCTQVIPGTGERRGYCLTMRGTGRRGGRIQRFWQANSERRARAYQGHFFPEEKVESVRRVRVRRNGGRIEGYTPEQCNVMLPGVVCTIDDDKIY